MSFDTSRFIFDAWNNYSGVVMEQGRVQLDSDWNEWLAELMRRIQAGTLDTLGRAVYPSTTPFAFQITATTDAAGNNHLNIGPGRESRGAIGRRLGSGPRRALRFTAASGHNAHRHHRLHGPALLPQRRASLRQRTLRRVSRRLDPPHHVSRRSNSDRCRRQRRHHRPPADCMAG
jgi:hypothetical protein